MISKTDKHLLFVLQLCKTSKLWTTVVVVVREEEWKRMKQKEQEKINDDTASDGTNGLVWIDEHSNELEIQDSDRKKRKEICVALTFNEWECGVNAGSWHFVWFRFNSWENLSDFLFRLFYFSLKSFFYLFFYFILFIFLLLLIKFLFKLASAFRCWVQQFLSFFFKFFKFSFSCLVEKLKAFAEATMTFASVYKPFASCNSMSVYRRCLIEKV